MTGHDPRGAAVAELEGEHARMLLLVQQARVALVDGDVAAARAALDALAMLHAQHAAREERDLLPRIGEDARWQAKVYLAEHRKLEQLGDALRERLAAHPSHVEDRVLRLALIDAHHPLQHLMEHHFAREEQGVFVECLDPDA